MPLFWLYGVVSLYRAYTTARYRQFKHHRRWVIRLTALLLGVTASRPVLVLLVAILVGSHQSFRRRITGFTDCCLFGLSVERPSIPGPRLSLETLLGRDLEEQRCLRRPSRDVACNRIIPRSGRCGSSCPALGRLDSEEVDFTSILNGINPVYLLSSLALTLPLTPSQLQPLCLLLCHKWGYCTIYNCRRIYVPSSV